MVGTIFEYDNERWMVRKQDGVFTYSSRLNEEGKPKVGKPKRMITADIQGILDMAVVKTNKVEVVTPSEKVASAKMWSKTYIPVTEEDEEVKNLVAGL